MLGLLADMLVSAIDPLALQTQNDAEAGAKGRRGGQYGSYRNVR